MERLRFASLEEAATVTSFVPELPLTLPPGYQRSTLTYTWPGEIRADLKTSFDSKGPRAPFEVLSAKYVDEQGNTLSVNQGYSVGVEGLYENAPDAFRGRMTAGPREVLWVSGSPKYEYTTDDQGRESGRPVPGEWDDTGYAVIYWESSDAPRGKGWEISPDGDKTEYQTGGYPFVFAIISQNLPVAELVKIAASVP